MSLISHGQVTLHRDRRHTEVSTVLSPSFIHMSEQPPRVLIVDDDENLARLISKYLVDHGFEVSLEHVGIVAAQRIANEQPDLVVLDVMLPGADGLTLSLIHI